MNARLVALKEFTTNGITYGPSHTDIALEDVATWPQSALANRLTNGFVRWEPLEPLPVFVPPSAEEIGELAASDESQDAGKKAKKGKAGASDESQG